MTAPQIASNPFMLMTNPEVILQALEGSERLGRLQRRICRPLDKPLLAHTGDATSDYDREVDAAPDLEPEAPEAADEV